MSQIFLFRSIDTADFETMIDCAGKDGSLPKETIEMWRKAMSRVENEPEKSTVNKKIHTESLLFS